MWYLFRVVNSRGDHLSMLFREFLLPFHWAGNVLLLLVLTTSASGEPCPDFDCYIETLSDQQILDCDYRVNLKFLSQYRLIRCEYDARRKGVFLSASAADDNFVNRLAHDIFKRISSLVSPIEEFVISHIKVGNLSRVDFTSLGRLKILTLMKPDFMEEDSLVDIADPKYFQFYVYCADDDLRHPGFTQLRMPSRGWRVIVRNCGYTSRCHMGSCVDGVALPSEFSIKFKPNRHKISPEIVFHSSSCTRRGRTCPVPSTEAGDMISTAGSSKVIAATRQPPSQLLLKVMQVDGTQDNSPAMEKIEVHSPPWEMSKHTIIIILVIAINAALLIILVGLAVYKFRQRSQDRKPCRGKHTIVLD